MAKDREFDVLGFGTNAVDFLIRVPNYPEFNTKVELNEYVQAAGGEIASSMAGLRRLGVRTAYAGRFGEDEAGAFGLTSLIDEGVDVSLAEKIPEAKTQTAFIVIDMRNGERTVIWQRDERLKYSAAEAPVEAVKKTKVLHISPHDSEACIVLAEEAKRNYVIVSIDIDRVFEGTKKLLSSVDILVMSSDFPERLIAISDLRTALTEIAARYGCSVAGITLGESGSLLYCGGTFIKTPGFAVPGGCQDTTGAGDAFRAGLLYGLLTGESIEASAVMANAVAALKCRSVGARTALPNETELKSFLKNL
ncbi:MAG: carbohydrate kinase family protein [Blastocatellia bacterium]